MAQEKKEFQGEEFKEEKDTRDFQFSETRIENIMGKDLIPITTRVEASSTAANYGVFFQARSAYEIMWVAESHTTAGTDGGAVTLNIERLSGTEALDAGDTILVSGFNLKGAANTVSIKQKFDLQNRLLRPGDRLALKDSGALTSVAGVCVTIYLKPAGRGHYL